MKSVILILVGSPVELGFTPKIKMRHIIPPSTEACIPFWLSIQSFAWFREFKKRYKTNWEMLALLIDQKF